LLFFYVYTSPFVFSASFKFVTPFPAVVVALGFYGIAAIGQTIEESFDWTEPKHDLTGLGRRIYRENKMIVGLRDSLVQMPKGRAAGAVTEAFENSRSSFDTEVSKLSMA